VAKVLCSVVPCVAVCCSALNVCGVTHSVFADCNRGDSSERGVRQICSLWGFAVGGAPLTYICLLETTRLHLRNDKCV